MNFGKSKKSQKPAGQQPASQSASQPVSQAASSQHPATQPASQHPASTQPAPSQHPASIQLASRCLRDGHGSWLQASGPWPVAKKGTRAWSRSCCHSWSLDLLERADCLDITGKASEAIRVTESGSELFCNMSKELHIK